MTDELVAWLRTCLDGLEARARAMLDLDWPVEVWVTPADMQGTREGDGELQGSVSVHEYAPKRYARLWAKHGGGGVVNHVEHGWVVHDSAQEVWSVEQGSALLARVEAERRLIEAYERCDLDPHVLLDVLRRLAYGHRFDAEGWDTAWAPDGVEETG